MKQAALAKLGEIAAVIAHEVMTRSLLLGGRARVGRVSHWRKRSATHATPAAMTNHDNVRVPPPPRKAVTGRMIDVREVAVLSERFRNALSPSPQSVDQ